MAFVGYGSINEFFIPEFSPLVWVKDLVEGSKLLMLLLQLDEAWSTTVHVCMLWNTVIMQQGLISQIIHECFLF
jgi:hypothetical protein